MIKALSIMINEALTSFYSQQIDDKIKPISTLFNYIKSLLGFNKKVTTTNIDNFFENPDMLNSSAEKIISYVNDFEKKGLLNAEGKMNKVLDVLIKIYTNINGFAQNSEPSNNYIKAEDLPSYVYYTDKFWCKFLMFHDDYDPRIEELAFLAKANIPQRFYGNNSRLKFNRDRNSLLGLEKYFERMYYDMERPRESEPVRRKFRVKERSVSESEPEDLGGEIDAELGL